MSRYRRAGWREDRPIAAAKARKRPRGRSRHLVHAEREKEDEGERRQHHDPLERALYRASRRRGQQRCCPAGTPGRVGRDGEHIDAKRHGTGERQARPPCCCRRRACKSAGPGRFRRDRPGFALPQRVLALRSKSDIFSSRVASLWPWTTHGRSPPKICNEASRLTRV